MIKVVLDTNIYLSGLIFPDSMPEEVLNLGRNRRILIYISPFILFEIKNILVKKFDCTEDYAKKLEDEILRFTIIVQPLAKINVIKDNKDDNRILECAVTAKANFLVSGDKKHILCLKKIKNTEIVSAKDFLNHFELISKTGEKK